MAVFSKNKTGASGAGEEDLVSFYIASDGKLKLRLANGVSQTLAVESTGTVSANTWAFVAGLVDYGTTTTDHTTAQVIINKTAGTAADTSSEANSRFYIEFTGSITSIGMEQNYTTALASDNFFDGFMYKLAVSKAVFDMGALDTFVTATCGPFGAGTAACDFCPAGGTCISDCTASQLSDSCDNCDSLCDPCVRAGTICELCDNPKCTTCNTFAANTCTACITNAEKSGGDCSCVSGKIYFDATNECKCDPLCDTCSGTDRYHCTVCVGSGLL
ncbi:MAG: hypothetical protein V2I33_26445 [Kangiellaceae bacterium]|jgi:hypothetical protein|nr:hypothetical protein [Kangiellaceae bacterium]